MKALNIGNPIIDSVKLPERARQELVTFYEFLVFKYQGKTHSRRERRTILNTIFQEASGKLPANYMLNREALHER